MKKGFTLIELLGVIVLLSLIIVLIMPNIINSIKKINRKSDIYSASVLYKAADSYILHSGIYEEKNGNKYCIPINKLVDEGLVEAPVRYNDANSVEDIMTIEATYNNKWNYSIVKNEECEVNINIICNRVVSSIKGNVPTGLFLPGDEYVCDLNDTVSGNYFILKTNGSKVYLIASTNITDSSWYSTSNNSYGPVTAYNALNTSTSNWNNIPVIKNFSYIDNNDCTTCGYSSIFTRKNDSSNTIYTTTITGKDNSKTTYDNLKARLPILSEVNSVGCTTANNSCPEWLKGSYYLNDSLAGSNTNAYIITTAGSISSTSITTSIGIRPVIELYKSDLE